MRKSGKYYLGGLDWMILTMCRSAMRHTGGVGNASQIVLQLNGLLDVERFSASVQEFASAFPILTGRAGRDWLLRPCWRLPGKPIVPSIRVEAHYPEPDAVHQTLEALVNTPFRNDREYVAFHLLYPADGMCLLAMTFDHRLLDARGAEQILLLLSRQVSGGVSLKETDILPELSRPGLFTQLKEGLASIRCVGETIHKSVIGSGMILMDTAVETKGNPGRILLHTLDEEATNAWLKRADRDAGYLMFMPYALAAATTAFGKLSTKESGSFIIPCTTDLRPPGLSWKNTFFNYSSIFFFKADSAAVSNRTEMIGQFKSQFFSQTKTKFPRRFEQFMGLMRFLPLRLFEWMNSWNHASFSFASVGESLFEGESFCGLEVGNLYHMPLVPPQVGLGFFFSRINGQLNLGISWREGLLDDQKIDILKTTLLEF